MIGWYSGYKLFWLFAAFDSCHVLHEGIHEDQVIRWKFVFTADKEHITNPLNAGLSLPLVICKMEVFTSEDVTKILWKKLVVVIGDSSKYYSSRLNFEFVLLPYLFKEKRFHFIS